MCTIAHSLFLFAGNSLGDLSGASNWLLVKTQNGESNRKKGELKVNELKANCLGFFYVSYILYLSSA